MQVEFGEQVMAKVCSKSSSTSRKIPLTKRTLSGIWLGINEAIFEHVVILLNGKAIKVRTAYRRPMAERWCKDQVLSIKAIPIRPGPDKELIEIQVFVTENEMDVGPTFEIRGHEVNIPIGSEN